jgi:hypothetical protein
MRGFRLSLLSFMLWACASSLARAEEYVIVDLVGREEPV